jgi:hypothetical protein
VPPPPTPEDADVGGLAMKTVLFVMFLVWLTLAAGASLVGPPPIR